MATFKEIRGQLIKKYTTNPTNPLEGQMWYNNTTGTLKGMLVTEAWSSSAPLITPRHSMAGAGTQTVALGIGGNNSGFKNETEEYNGSGWATGGALTTARGYLAGTGLKLQHQLLVGILHLLQAQPKNTMVPLGQQEERYHQ